MKKGLTQQSFPLKTRVADSNSATLVLFKGITRFTRLLWETAHFYAGRDKQNPVPCLNETENPACVSTEEWT